MDGLKMVRLFLVLALAMTVGSQPLEAIVTSGGASLSTQPELALMPFWSGQKKVLVSVQMKKIQQVSILFPFFHQN